MVKGIGCTSTRERCPEGFRTSKAAGGSPVEAATCVTAASAINPAPTAPLLNPAPLAPLHRLAIEGLGNANSILRSPSARKQFRSQTAIAPAYARLAGARRRILPHARSAGR